MKKKLNYDYCQAAPVLEWMSQKWALVVMLRIEEYEKESIRFSELFRTIPQVSEKVLASTLDYLLQEHQCSILLVLLKNVLPNNLHLNMSKLLNLVFLDRLQQNLYYLIYVPR